MDSQYQAWNGETYQWPPPEGWEKRSDGRFWPPGQGPAAQETAATSPPPAPTPPAPTAATPEPVSLLPERSGPKAPRLGASDTTGKEKKSNKGLIIGLILVGLLALGVLFIAFIVSLMGSSRFDDGIGAFADVSLDQTTCLMDGTSASVTLFADNPTEAPADYRIEVSFTDSAGQISTHETRLVGVLPKNRATITVSSDSPLTGLNVDCRVSAATRKPTE